jgi:hypothetical protein
MNKQNIKQPLCRAFVALPIVGALTVGALLTSPQAHAEQPVAAHGFTTDCENLISEQVAGPNTIVVLSITVTFTGTFDGEWVGTERDVFHADGLTGQGSGVFSGSVDGRFGTMTFSYTVAISPNGTKVVNRWVVEGTGGDLAGLHGEGAVVSGEEIGPTEECRWDRFALEYSGQIQFAP